MSKYDNKTREEELKEMVAKGTAEVKEKQLELELKGKSFDPEAEVASYPIARQNKQ